MNTDKNNKPIVNYIFRRDAYDRYEVAYTDAEGIDHSACTYADLKMSRPAAKAYLCGVLGISTEKLKAKKSK